MRPHHGSSGGEVSKGQCACCFREITVVAGRVSDAEGYVTGIA